MVEVKHVEQIADGWAVLGHVRVVLTGFWIGQIVAAAVSKRIQVPIALDELQNRDVVAVGMVYVAAFGERRNNNQRDARAVTEKVQRLNVAGIIVAAAFVHGDDERGL